MEWLSYRRVGKAGGAAVAVLLSSAALTSEIPREHLEFFEERIRPVLIDHCYDCHSATAAKAKGGLRVDTRDSLLRGGDSGRAAVVPGAPEKSLLLTAIRYGDTDLQMPPKSKLSHRQIADFTEWIRNGAPDPRVGNPDEASTVDTEVNRESAKHWAFQEPGDPVPPAVRGTGWARSPVDQFLLAALEARGLKPAPAASKPSLIRRATYDLTGLPPSPEEIARFEADTSADAFVKLVDRLLASPAYGERWARHWLDVARYADARDLIQLPAESDFREIWRYRDWVVKAFNEDWPYSQFARYQVAGDLLQPGTPDRLNEDGIVATGFLALADFVPGDNDKDMMIADYVNDQIDVTGRAFLGLTLGCARCHDHKFDPISSEDYYSLAGIFFSTRLVPSPVAGNTPLVRVPLLSQRELNEIEAHQASAQELDRQLQQRIRQLRVEYLDYLEFQAAQQTVGYLQAIAEYQVAKRSGTPLSPADLARRRGMDETILNQWLDWLFRPDPEEPLPNSKARPVLATLVENRSSAEGASESNLLLDDFGKNLIRLLEQRRWAEESLPPEDRALAAVESLQLRADDPNISTNAEGRVVHWPGRSRRHREGAVPPAGVTGPLPARRLFQGVSQPVLRFTGKDLMQSPQPVPNEGTVVLLVKRAEGAGGGQRLIGWEDSNVGKHGVGLMTTADGGWHALVRQDGLNGDIVVSGTDHPAGPDGFQIVTLSWGPQGSLLRLQGAIAGTNVATKGVSSDPEIQALQVGGPGSGGAARFEGDLAELRVYRWQLEPTELVRIENQISNQWFHSETKSLPASSDSDLESVFDAIASPQGPFRLAGHERDERFRSDLRLAIRNQEEELKLTKQLASRVIPLAVAVQEGGPAKTPHEGFNDSPVFHRGNPKTPGKIARRGLPRIFAARHPHEIREGSGRRELAEWLASPENPLTARVMVNRLWQHHFGDGIVRTAGNFGMRGEPPSNPELLDFLARQFIRSGWSVKAMHRLVMLSSAYQQSTTAHPATAASDPENRLFGRMKLRRLDAEEIRDALLSVTGQLDPALGGPGFQDEFSFRRSLYLMTVRTGGGSTVFGSLFDQPDGGRVVDQRTVSTVAPQALFWMNDPLVLRQAKALAERLSREPDGDRLEGKLTRAYRLLYGRDPEPWEIEIGRRILADAPPERFESYCQALLCANEFIEVN